MSVRQTITPDYSDNGYVHFTIPAGFWSGSEWNEETLIVCRDPDGSIRATTEMSQCTHRDLTSEELHSVLAEFNLVGISA